MSIAGNRQDAGTGHLPNQPFVLGPPRQVQVNPGPPPSPQSTGDALAGDALTLSAYFRWKGILDRAVAVILLVVILPILGVLALLVRLTSPGRAIFRQSRTGKDGRTFLIYKLRSMREDSERGTGAVWCQTNDPRVTPLGRVLRELHLDEFPQIFNVIKGDMSLIGPRPERPEFVEVLAKRIPGYMNRLAVPPGVTGLAQLNLPPDTNLESVRRKLVLDLEYVKHASLLLDLRILAYTAAYLFRLPLLDIFGLRREVLLGDSEVQRLSAGNGSPQ